MKFAWIKDHGDQFAIEVMCQVLEVSDSGYYAWLKRPLSPRRQRRERLAGKVVEIHRQSRCVYGAPRVHRELLSAGEKVCRKTVAKIMREARISSVVSRRFVPCTTDSNHDHPVAENRLDRDFTADLPNQK